MTIQEILQPLVDQCDESISIIGAVNNSHYLTTPELKTIRDMVVKQAFLSVFTEWEHFLENATVAYALGEVSIAGFAPTKYVSPLDEDHANQLIKGTSTYPDWTKMELVIKIEKAFFENGEPFVSAIQGFQSKYNEIKKVRNVIVHNSVKSRDEFNSLVRTALRAASVGISPVEFLLSQKNREPFFYVTYITHIKNAATLIANYAPHIPPAETESTS